MQRQLLIIGLDWGESTLRVEYVVDGKVRNHSLAHTPFAVLEWLESLSTPFARIAIGCERDHGWLVQMLLNLPYVDYYRINPATLHYYRKSHDTSGAKSDPKDAKYLRMMLHERFDTLSPIQATEKLGARLDKLNHQRRSLVEERKRISNRLTDQLRQVYPGLLRVCDMPTTSPLAIAMLKRFPCQRMLAQADWETVETLLRSHHVRKFETRREAHQQMVTLQVDAEAEKDDTMILRHYRQQLEQLQQQIQDLDRRIQQVANKHPHYRLFRDLPGAGATLAPRLLCLFIKHGDLPVKELTQYLGTVPIIISSGKSSYTCARFVKPVFEHQSIVEFAGQSRRFSSWCKAFHDYHRDEPPQRLQQQNERESSASIDRKLANKWLRILSRMWQTKTPYDEQLYINRLKQKQAPLVHYLDPCA